MSHPLPKISVRTDGVTCRAEFDDPEWTCQDCHGRGGSMERDEEGYEVFVACRCKSALRRLDLFNAAGIGKRFASATLGSYTRHNNLQGRALQKAEEFSMLYPKVENGLLFWGPVGTGKTHLAVAIFRELTLRKGVSCRFVDYGNLLQDLRRAFSGGGGDAALMVPLVEAELLVIDELGKGRGTEWEETVLDDLVSRRYNAGRTTLCTTNFDPRDEASSGAAGPNPSFTARSSAAAGRRMPTLKERIGERVYSRLCDMCEFVQVSGADYRRRGA